MHAAKDEPAVEALEMLPLAEGSQGELHIGVKLNKIQDNEYCRFNAPVSIS